MKEKEKRSATRVQVPLVGVMTFEAEKEGPKRVEVVAKDVSEEGAYLWAGACPRVGEKITINLHCSSELKQLFISLEAVGTVLRVDELENRRYGFAVKFEGIPD
ncbi:PilZ domain-containing protein [Acidobacteria bacterium AH-259-D05]|nr:PilZ domain-containing protein [Acidobacteria bacterium AH-259-D05]